MLRQEFKILGYGSKQHFTGKWKTIHKTLIITFCIFKILILCNLEM